MFKGVPVHNLRPREMSDGELVRAKGLTKQQKNADTVRAVVQVGEIVVPRFYQKTKRSKKLPLAKMTEQWLRELGVKLPGMK